MPAEPTITANTRTTIGAAIVVCGAIVGGAWRIESSLSGVGERLSLVEYRLQALEDSHDDRWRRSEMRAWVRDFKERNPTVSTPTVE